MVPCAAPSRLPTPRVALLLPLGFITLPSPCESTLAPDNCPVRKMIALRHQSKEHSHGY